MMRTILFPLAATTLTALCVGQHTILMTSGTSDERTLGLDLTEIDLIRNDEIYEVTPFPGAFYTARPFLPTSTQWAYVGDLDTDGQYVEDSVDGPGGAIDAIFVKNGATDVTPRDVFFSIASTTGINIPGLGTSDVIRYSDQGMQETFLTEAQLELATGGTTLNLDALCQSALGDLFFSVSLTETLSIGSVDDGDLLMIPASAITYDVDGNVSAVTANSVLLMAAEADLIAMVNNSGFRTSVGGQITTTFELSGLEIDPAGGTFLSPVNGTTVLPNLLFCWSDFSNDGALISTDGGGAIALVNNVPMGSDIATQGTQIGWLPDSTGTNGPGGLALIPIGDPTFTLQNYPRNLHTQGSGQTLLQFQASGGTPSGATVIGLSFSTAIPGGSFTSSPAPPPLMGELFLSMTPLTVGIFINDELGNCGSQFLVVPTGVLSGSNVIAQALDLSTFELSTPAALSFL